MPAGDKGKGKGERERAEVSRSRAATSHLSCRRGRSRRAGGRWWQCHPVPLSASLPPSLFPLSECFSVPLLYTPTSPPPPFLIPLPYLLHFSHNERFRRLTDALAQNDRISFTSSAAENYQRKRSGGFSAVSLSWHIPRPRNNYARASFGGKERVARYILNFERSQKKHYRRQRYTQSQIKVRCGTRGTEFCLTQ